MTIKLVDCEEMHAKNPGTFWLAPREERAGLQVGDLAKIIFQQDGLGGERMWMIITEANSEGVYKGTLDNDPVVIDAKHGDAFDFEAKHIAQYERVREVVSA